MKLTRLSIGEEQIFLGAGDGLEHHLEVLHIVRQGTLRHFSVNVIIATGNMTPSLWGHSKF